MNYARYSKAELEALTPGSSELQQRLTEMAVDVKFELNVALAAKFKEIAKNINGVGHELLETSDSKPGELDYAQGERPSRFYLAADTVISVGYLGTSPSDAPVADHLQWQNDWESRRS